MEKKVKKEPIQPKVKTKRLKLKRDYLTDKGLLKAGDYIEVGKNGEQELINKKII